MDDSSMPCWHGMLALCAAVMLAACTHPLEIIGEGDIYSASGDRNCYLEDFRAGADSCQKNLVVTDYVETYYGVAREEDGWEFSHWENCFTGADATVNECSFNVDAAAVRKAWGATVPPLVAVFQQQNPTPEPVAVYSYAIDGDGELIDPLPLADAHLERKVAYFSFPGDFVRANFWCCKVPDGGEAHAEKVEDRVPPLVLQVDLAALPDDAGLQRELYADLFTSATEYTGHSVYWTLARPETGPVLFNDGGDHLIDFDISTGLRVENGTSVTIAPGVIISSVTLYGSNLTNNGGELSSVSLHKDSLMTVNGGAVGVANADTGSGVIMNDGVIGKVELIDACGGFKMIGGRIGQLSALFECSPVSIEGGSVGEFDTYDADIAISGGEFGPIKLCCDTGFGIRGGHFTVSLLVDSHSFGSISGGTFASTVDVGSISYLVFHGELTLGEALRDDAEYPFNFSRQVSGTLEDGTPIDLRVRCQDMCEQVYVAQSTN